MSNKKNSYNEVCNVYVSIGDISMRMTELNKNPKKNGNIMNNLAKAVLNEMKKNNGVMPVNVPMKEDVYMNCFNTPNAIK